MNRLFVGHGHESSIRGKSKDAHRVRAYGRELLPRMNIPGAHRPIPAGRMELLAVRGETDTVDRFAMPREVAYLRTARQVPQADHRVFPAAGERLAVGAEGDAVNLVAV